MATSAYPGAIAQFGADTIEGDYIMPGHINQLRAEVLAIQQALGTNLANTLSAAMLQARGNLITASAAGVLAVLTAGANGTLLSSDSTATTGLAWKQPSQLLAPRVASIASSSAPAPNCATTDQFCVTALATDAILSAPTGTASDGQKLIVRLRDNGTVRALGFSAVYRPIGQALPTGTTAGKTLYLGFIFNAADQCWDCLAMAQEA